MAVQHELKAEPAFSAAPRRLARVLWRAGRVLAPALWLALSPAAPAGAGGPKVLVTIKPVHALVAGVMEGVGVPGLLIEGWASPHGYALRPSEARALARAGLIFWIGEELEGFLERPLAGLATKARIVKLMSARGVSLAGARDPHIWLDADNARAIVRAAAAALAEADPTNRQAYDANAARTIARIEALDGELRAALRPVAHLPYLVAHDAYRYFGQRYRLNGVGALALAPERQPGARHIAQLRRTAHELGVRCLFTEPQFEPAIASSIAEDTGIRIAILDPLGAGLAPGPEAWFELMRANARSLITCLGGGG